MSRHLALEKLQHLLGHVRRRHDDGAAGEIMLRCHGGSARFVLPAEIFLEIKALFGQPVQIFKRVNKFDEFYRNFMDSVPAEF
jgi:hypothetical protein